jgi:hypothetical protein
MIERIRLVAIMYDGRIAERETTPMQIETAKGDLLKWMYECMDKAERTRIEDREWIERPNGAIESTAGESALSPDQPRAPTEQGA